MRRYNLTAQMYDSRYSEEQETKYKAALESANINHGSVVLDVGCGTGLFFIHLAEEAGLVIGVDLSRSLLHLAKGRSKVYSDVYLVRADADYLPFKRDVFTHIFAFTVLQNMPNPSETLKQFKLVAKCDACFVVTGLKAAISMQAFWKFLEVADLQAISLRNNDALRCYIVTCVHRHM
jgi:ubiquinone/menaquinone biosynthesis C-methylase UbiE